MISLIRPQIYIPIYGHPYMLHGNANNAYRLGIPKDRVFLGRNGQIMEFTRDHAEMTDCFVPHRLITVDGSFIGYSKEDTLHERYQLSSAGILTMSLAKKGNDYIIRMDEAGFPGIHSLPDLRQQIEHQTLSILRGDLTKFKDLDALRKHIERKTGDLIFRLTSKEPVVIVLVH
jgi:ribonuclease J